METDTTETMKQVSVEGSTGRASTALPAAGVPQQLRHRAVGKIEACCVLGIHISTQRDVSQFTKTCRPRQWNSFPQPNLPSLPCFPRRVGIDVKCGQDRKALAHRAFHLPLARFASTMSGPLRNSSDPEPEIQDSRPEFWEFGICGKPGTDSAFKEAWIRGKGSLQGERLVQKAKAEVNGMLKTEAELIGAPCGGVFNLHAAADQQSLGVCSSPLQRGSSDEQHEQQAPPPVAALLKRVARTTGDRSRVQKEVEAGIMDLPKGVMMCICCKGFSPGKELGGFKFCAACTMDWVTLQGVAAQSGPNHVKLLEVLDLPRISALVHDHRYWQKFGTLPDPAQLDGDDEEEMAKATEQQRPHAEPTSAAALPPGSAPADGLTNNPHREERLEGYAEQFEVWMRHAAKMWNAVDEWSPCFDDPANYDFNGHRRQQEWWMKPDKDFDLLLWAEKNGGVKFTAITLQATPTISVSTSRRSSLHPPKRCVGGEFTIVCENATVSAMRSPTAHTGRAAEPEQQSQALPSARRTLKSVLDPEQVPRRTLKRVLEPECDEKWDRPMKHFGVV